MAGENQRPQKSTISKTKLTVNRPAASVIRGKQANASECTKSTGRHVVWKLHRLLLTIKRKAVVLGVEQASRFDRRIACQQSQILFTRRAIAERDDGYTVMSKQARVVLQLLRLESALLIEAKSSESKAGKYGR